MQGRQVRVARARVKLCSAAARATRFRAHYPRYIRMKFPPRDRTPFFHSQRCRFGVLAPFLLAFAVASCVTENMTTGEMVPRGNQRYPFEKVEKEAGRLEDGMTKYQVTVLLGSPAEVDKAGDVWVYLPERYAVLVPARAATAIQGRQARGTRLPGNRARRSVLS